MRHLPFPLRPAAAAALLITLAACPGPVAPPARPLDKGQVLDPVREGSDTIRRSFQCLQRDSEGNCLANKCTQGPGGATFNCASFAKACIDAGLHWSGTQEGGTCSVIL